MAAPAIVQVGPIQLPSVHQSLCFGAFAVPYTVHRLLNAQGQFQDVHLTDLSKASGGRKNHSSFQWLWQPLGMSREAWMNGAAHRLPLMVQIEDSIRTSGKRKRDGKFYDQGGHLAPQLLTVSLRGRELQVLNDRRSLQVNLTRDAATMRWFAQELFQEMRAAPVQDAPLAHDPAASHDDPAPGEPSPIEEEEPEPEAPLADPGVPIPLQASRAAAQQAVDHAVTKSLVRLRAHPPVKTCSWDKTYGRFSIRAGPAHTHKAQYFPVQRYRALHKELPGSLDALLQAIDTCVSDYMAEHPGPAQPPIAVD